MHATTIRCFNQKNDMRIFYFLNLHARQLYADNIEHMTTATRLDVRGQ